MTSMIMTMAQLKKAWSERYEQCEQKRRDYPEAARHLDGHSESQCDVEFHVGRAVSLFEAESIDDAVIQLCELANVVDGVVAEAENCSVEDERAIRRLTYSIYKALLPYMKTKIEETGYADYFYPSRDPWLLPDASLEAYNAQSPRDRKSAVA